MNKFLKTLNELDPGPVVCLGVTTLLVIAGILLTLVAIFAPHGTIK